jgi:hypothetical protein
MTGSGDDGESGTTFLITTGLCGSWYLRADVRKVEAGSR